MQNNSRTYFIHQRFILAIFFLQPCFLITLDPLSEDYPEFKGFNKAYINPHILEIGGEEVSMEEGRTYFIHQRFILAIFFLQPCFLHCAMRQNRCKTLGFNKAYINPHILEIGGEEVSMEEGCLSLPGIHETVKRGNKIRVKYMDEDFVEHEEEVEGYLARVMQHEFDHLDGKMFIDHISALRKQMIKGKLNTMLKGKARSSYKMKQVK